MSTTLTQANSQWSSRPADERFGSLKAMHQAATSFKTSAIVEEIKTNALRVAAQGSELVLHAGRDVPAAALTNWSFSQLASRASAPTAYLKNLPAKLAADCLNHGLAEAGTDEKGAQLLLGSNGVAPVARAITSDKYSRIWNADITARLLELEATGPWQPAPAAFDGSRGLYLGDRDMFAFLVDNERRIFEKGPGGGLSRGFFCWNSEVGDAAFGIMTFWYEYVCGNHRVWGAQDIAEAKIIHIGRDQSSKAFDMMSVEVKKYAEASAADDELKVERCRRHVIGAKKDDVLDAIFKLKVPSLTKTLAGQAYDLAEKRVDWYGAPNTVWGYAGGLTEIARDMPNASDRHAIDCAATRIMEMAAA
ncbi:hypothetical protein H8A95_15860 [Bradyrhizobium sp. Pear76]|uniref:hypothetical protein n=1 Tax=Bradyrhizobium oropedii TaxID=1571201 RepID=UPI001E580DA9|nr:hypothetical protein [Bradyrhizobium oropedii]MCC8963746.1 hypothetical protein [Bradyrhizobium oropedii]